VSTVNLRGSITPSWKVMVFVDVCVCDDDEQVDGLLAHKRQSFILTTVGKT